MTIINNCIFAEMKIEVKKIKSFTGHAAGVYALSAFSSNAHLFLTGSSDKFVAMWNLETLQPEKFAAQFPSIVYSICHITEKNLLLVGTYTGGIHILDLENKTEIKILQHHKGPVFEIKFSERTNCFYSSGGDGCFAVCSLDTLSVIIIKKLCEEKIRSIDFNYTTSEIAVALGDCTVRVFDLFTLDEKNNFIAHKLSSNKVCFSCDGNLLLTGGRDAHLNIWETKNYSLLKSIPAHNFAIYDIVFSPNKKLFATASRDKTVKIWDAESFELLVRINNENYEGHKNSVNKLLWSEYNNYLISTGDDRAILVWEIAN